MGFAAILGEFAQSAFVPGVNRGLLAVLHVVFVMLLLTLASLIVLTGLTNVHTWALLGLAVGLYTSLLWYALWLPHDLRHAQGLSARPTAAPAVPGRRPVKSRDKST